MDAPRTTRRAVARGIGLLLAVLAAVFLALLWGIGGAASARDHASVATPAAPAGVGLRAGEASRTLVAEVGGRDPVPIVALDASDALIETPVTLLSRPADMRAARSEREARRFLRELAREGPEELPRTVERLLRDEASPDARKVAALRTLYEEGSARTEELFLLALTRLPDVSGPEAESVPSFAVRFLGQRAQRDPLARRILRAVVVDPVPAASGAPAPRRRAAVLLAQAGAESDLEALGLVLRAEPDEALLRGVLTALAERDDSPAALRILAEHGWTAAEARGARLEE